MAIWECKDFKERLAGNFYHRLCCHVSESSRFDVYNSFKTCVYKEEYLDFIKVSLYRTALARFRLGVSPFNAHKNRYAHEEISQHCPFCVGCREDEVHVVMHCPMYADLRNRYISLQNACDAQRQVVLLLKCKDEETTVRLAKFLYLAWRRRTERNMDL